ncbi:MAG: hypothetical protein V4653_02590, partial [Pseudomonadota bacterium]
PTSAAVSPSDLGGGFAVRSSRPAAQAKLGTPLLNQALSGPDQPALHESVAALRLVLAEQRRDRVPWVHAQSRMQLARALAVLGSNRKPPHPSRRRLPPLPRGLPFPAASGPLRRLNGLGGAATGCAPASPA